MSSLVPQGVYCVGIPAPLLARGMTELSSSELRVLLYIYLHTLGYQKSEDSLTYKQMISGITTRDGKQLDHGAGVSRRSLVEALAGLEKKGYIKRQAGANSASSKIKLCFNAPEFQNSASTNERAADSEPEQQARLTSLKQPVTYSTKQKPHLTSVQILHSSCKNQHVINHGDVRAKGEKKSLSQESKKIPAADLTNNADLSEATNYLLANIPNLAKTDAQIISQIAIVKNGRNLAYLEQLVQYILNQPKIHTPAAVLTHLVKLNSERIVTNKGKNIQDAKTTCTRVSTSQLSAKNAARQPQSYSFALNYLAKANKDLPAELNLETSPVIVFQPESQDSVAIATRTPKSCLVTRNQKSKNRGGFIQSCFDWDNQTNFSVSPGAGIGKAEKASNYLAALPVVSTAVSGLNAYPPALPVLDGFQPSLLTENTLQAYLETALERLQADIRGRLRFSVSRELFQLLQGARLEADSVRRDGQQSRIKLKFANELIERLLSVQDYQIIKLSLRQSLQSLGKIFTIEIAGEYAQNEVYLTTEQAYCRFAREQAV